jgi:hypothetical protein
MPSSDFGKSNWLRFGILGWPRRLRCVIGRHLDVAPPAVVGILMWPHLVLVFLLVECVLTDDDGGGERA